MPLSPRTIRAHEWIGLRARIVSAPNPALVGMTGTVEDESRNLFTIRMDHGLVRVQKQMTTFEVRLPSGNSVVVEGESVKYRPEDRVKRGIRKW